MLSHANFENIETKWYRQSEAVENGFTLSVTECIDRNTCNINTASIVRDAAEKKVYSTTSHTDYCGGMHNQLCCSTALQNGKFEENKSYTEFTDTAIAGDIIPLIVGAGEEVTVGYTLSVFTKPKNTSIAQVDKVLYGNKSSDALWNSLPNIHFNGEWEGVNADILNAFLKNVCRQTEFCARAKNYAGPFIGIRDIFQQLEAALMWIPKYCRGKIIEALHFIGDDGRAPRQYSYPTANGMLPEMDLRMFVDQGVWIISTVYTYLAFTDDFSILDEVCGYYDLTGGKVNFSSEKGSVLDHLIRITEFLVSNLDTQTGCLRALYGDWNDALDGLGKTTDTDKAFGSGVSVMASLQLYRNLGEMSDILRKLNKFEMAERYQSVRSKLQANLQKYAVVENDSGARKILHGWGDKRAYFVGSFCDNDGANRDGLTSNAFWVLSRAIDWDSSMKADILSAYERLDSKYGLKTFAPYFAPSNDKVGRINRLPAGTAENGAVYIHASAIAKNTNRVV